MVVYKDGLMVQRLPKMGVAFELIDEVEFA